MRAGHQSGPFILARAKMFTYRTSPCWRNIGMNDTRLLAAIRSQRFHISHSVRRWSWKRATCVLLLLSGIARPLVGEDTAAIHVLWQTSLLPGGAPPIGFPAVDGGRLFLIYSGVQAYSAHDGRLLWQVPVSYLPTRLLANNNAVFVAEAKITALDSETGRSLWEFSPDANTSLGEPALYEGVLFVGTSSHRIYALRVSDGHKLWERDISPKWRYAAVVRGIVVKGDRLYASMERSKDVNGVKSSGLVVALDTRNGNVLWRYHTSGGVQRQGASSAPVIAQHLILVSDSLSNAVFALNSAKGNEVWRFQGEPGFAGFAQSPFVVGETVYAVSADQYVYALHLDSGKLQWRTRMPASNMAAAPCGDSVLVNFEGIGALDPVTGVIKKTIFSDEAEFVSSGFAVDSRRAYVVGPKAVYAIECQ